MGAASLRLLYTNAPIRENLFSAFLIISEVSGFSNQGRGLRRSDSTDVWLVCVADSGSSRSLRESSDNGDDISSPLKMTK